MTIFDSIIRPMKKQGTPHPKPETPRYYFREWRQYRNLTQEQLADRIGVSSPTISQLERGIQGFRNETLEAIADALTCEPGDLLSVNPKKAGEVVDLMRVLKEKGLDTLLRERDLDLVARIIAELPKRA